jgi:hypothetical protein
MCRLLIASCLLWPATAAADFTWAGGWQGGMFTPPDAPTAAASAYAYASNLSGVRGYFTQEVLFSRPFRVTGGPSELQLSTALIGRLDQLSPPPGGSVFAAVTASAFATTPSGGLRSDHHYSGTQVVNAADVRTVVFDPGDYSLNCRLFVEAGSLSGPTTAISDFQTAGRHFAVTLTPVAEPTAALLFVAAAAPVVGLARRVVKKVKHPPGTR